MTEALFPDEAWVAVQLRDGAEVNITVDIDSFEESGFEREIEYRPFFQNSKVAIKKPQGDGELTMNAKITRALWDQILWGGSGSDFQSGGDQDPYRITFLVTKDSAVTTATEALGSAYDHYRKIYANCFMTGFNPKLEAEGMLEGEATFMVSPTDETGTANVRTQVTVTADGDGGHAAIGSFTTADKW